MSKFKFLIHGRGPNGLQKCSEEYDFEIISNPWNDFGYQVRFCLYDNKHKLLGQMAVFCEYQQAGTINELCNFDSYYKIIEELPNSFASSIDVRIYYEICKYLPQGGDRKEFAKALRIMSCYDYTSIRTCRCYKDGGCRSPYTPIDINKRVPKDNLHERILDESRNYYDFAKNNMTVHFKNDESLKLQFGYHSRIIWLDDLFPKNSSKKLYDIAMSLYNHYYNKNEQFNWVEPLDAGYNKVIFVSHKSFLDNYCVPKQPKELNQEDTNLYCYVGIQSRFDLGQYDDTEDILTIDKIPLRNINTIGQDLSCSYIEEKISFWSELCYEYSDLFNDSGLCHMLSGLNTFRGSSIIVNSKSINQKDFEKIENKHKVFIHTMVMILKNIQPYSIVLLDKPSTFLDMKQLNFLLCKMSKICEQLSSVLIIS